MTEQASITCRVCGMRSYHPKDVEYKYCGRCHNYTGTYSQDELEAAIGQLHERVGEACKYCSERRGSGYQSWPCPTIRSLELGEIR